MRSDLEKAAQNSEAAGGTCDQVLRMVQQVFAELYPNQPHDVTRAMAYSSQVASYTRNIRSSTIYDDPHSKKTV